MSHGRFEKQKKTKNKSLTVLKTVLIVLLVLLVVVCAAVAVTVNHVLDQLGSFDNDPMPTGTVSPDEIYEKDPTVEGQESMETMHDDDMTFETVDPLEGVNVVNILLIGTDKAEGNERTRSDSMILVSLNRDKKAIQLTSFLRDTYVQLPGWANNKLNAAYRFGGTELLNEALKVNFGVVVDGNVAVDFDEFQTIIDVLGGVDVEMSEDEAWALQSQFGVEHAQEGMNHLNGEEALGFCRIRYNSGGDYGRTERQRRVITAIMKSLTNAGLSGVLDLIDKVLPNVYTDIDKLDIINYATVGLGLLVDGAQIQSMQVPADDAHYQTMINEMSVLVPDLAMCREDLQDFIYTTE